MLLEPSRKAAVITLIQQCCESKQLTNEKPQLHFTESTMHTYSWKARFSVMTPAAYMRHTSCLLLHLVRKSKREGNCFIIEQEVLLFAGNNTAHGAQPAPRDILHKHCVQKHIYKMRIYGNMFQTALNLMWIFILHSL